MSQWYNILLLLLFKPPICHKKTSWGWDRRRVAAEDQLRRKGDLWRTTRSGGPGDLGKKVGDPFLKEFIVNANDFNVFGCPWVLWMCFLVNVKEIKEIQIQTSKNQKVNPNK